MLLVCRNIEPARQQKQRAGRWIDPGLGRASRAREFDGAAHDHERAVERDEVRTRCLGSVGVTVVRFESRDVLDNLEGVLQTIRNQTNP